MGKWFGQNSAVRIQEAERTEEEDVPSHHISTLLTPGSWLLAPAFRLLTLSTTGG
jgi:hypothetical protein